MHNDVEILKYQQWRNELKDNKIRRHGKTNLFDEEETISTFIRDWKTFTDFLAENRNK